MKKHPFILSLALLFSLSSCSSLFGGDGYSIESQTSYIDPATGNTIIVITFTDEEVEPLKITLTKGENGLDGNGIDKINTSVNEDNFVVEIIYTDKTIDPTRIVVPITNGQDGVSVTGLTILDDGTGNEEESVIIKFTYSDGSDSIPITIPKGKDGNGIASIVPLTNEADNTITLIISYTDGREPTRVTLKNGEDGISVIDISYDATQSNDDDYALKVTYSDGYTQTIIIPRPKSTVWYTGSGEPTDSTGKIGDFYIDLTNYYVYRKDINGWAYMFALSNSKPKPIRVIFNPNGGTFVGMQENAVVITSVLEGNVIPLESFEIPVYEGHEFLGWYTSSTYNPNAAKVTDLTPIYSTNDVLNLYAWWTN